MTKRLIGALIAICCLSLTAFSQTTEETKPGSTPEPKVEQFSEIENGALEIEYVGMSPIKLRNASKQ